MQTKKEIRKEFLLKRKNLSAETRAAYSLRIFEQLVESKEFKQADTILVYVSTEFEVSTIEFIDYCWSHNKIVAVPKVYGPHQMEFYRIDGFEDLRPGFKGIMEPYKVQNVTPEYGLIIIPGVAFDKEGYRLGYGGGYYDTYLQEHLEYSKAAVAFSVQITEKIPTESHDMKINVIYTEKGVCRQC